MKPEVGMMFKNGLSTKSVPKVGEIWIFRCPLKSHYGFGDSQLRGLWGAHGCGALWGTTRR